MVISKSLTSLSKSRATVADTVSLSESLASLSSTVKGAERADVSPKPWVQRIQRALELLTDANLPAGRLASDTPRRSVGAPLSVQSISRFALSPTRSEQGAAASDAPNAFARFSLFRGHSADMLVAAAMTPASTLRIDAGR